MSEQEIEEFIIELDKASRNLCVYPYKQTFECEDCYLCRVDYFNNVREDLRHNVFNYNNYIHKE